MRSCDSIPNVLYPTAALYVIFGLICVKGPIEWKRSLGGAACLRDAA
jgi:hypothetical protein